MTKQTRSAEYKKASVLRRTPRIKKVRWLETPGLEGDVCVFKVASEAPHIMVEAASGRSMTLTSSDLFLATPGHRESTRWVVGGIPDGGLIPGNDYWVLADSGVVGELVGDSPREKGHLGQVKYLGAVCNQSNQAINIREFALETRTCTDHGAPMFLVLGTSAEVGKTTAGVAIVQALRRKGYTEILALKATGTSSLTEIFTYQDRGASQVFDCVDFGLPTTYSPELKRVKRVLVNALDTCLSIPADAIVVECGGDILGANVPIFLEALKRKVRAVKVILAAPDALAALGATQVLSEMALAVDLITGPCTDTPTLGKRTQALCGVPTANMAGRSKGLDI